MGVIEEQRWWCGGCSKYYTYGEVVRCRSEHELRRLCIECGRPLISVPTSMPGPAESPGRDESFYQIPLYRVLRSRR